MNKVYGIKSDYAPVKDDASRVVVSYGCQDAEEGNAVWYEVYLYKRQISQLSLDIVKDAVIGDINERTDEKILTGFVWNGKPVYLSKENQENYLGALTAATMTEGASLPVKFKLGEDENGEPVYHTFNTLNSLSQFYLAGVQFINDCLNEGWAEKDAIEWEPYEEALKEIEEARIAAEEAARQAAEEEAARLAAEEAERLAKEQEERENLRGSMPGGILPESGE